MTISSALIDYLGALPNIDVLIASKKGVEFRLVGDFLPFLAARIEHCVLCPACSGTAGPADADCAPCFDEEAGGSTGYATRARNAHVWRIAERDEQTKRAVLMVLRGAV